MQLELISNIRSPLVSSCKGMHERIVHKCTYMYVHACYVHTMHNVFMCVTTLIMNMCTVYIHIHVHVHAHVHIQCTCT